MPPEPDVLDTVRLEGGVGVLQPGVELDPRHLLGGVDEVLHPVCRDFDTGRVALAVLVGVLAYARTVVADLVAVAFAVGVGVLAVVALAVVGGVLAVAHFVAVGIRQATNGRRKYNDVGFIGTQMLAPLRTGRNPSTLDSNRILPGGTLAAAPRPDRPEAARRRLNALENRWIPAASSLLRAGARDFLRRYGAISVGRWRGSPTSRATPRDIRAGRT